MILVVVAALGFPGAAFAQVYEPLRNSLQVSVGPSLTRYFGDMDYLPGQRTGMANNMSAVYQVKPGFGVGLSLTGNWNVAGYGEGVTFAVVRLGVRSHLREGRHAPFVSAAGLVGLGRAETGFGGSLSVGYRLGVGKVFSVSPVIRVDAVTPDHASDASVGGSRFDVFANFGIELAFTLPKRYSKRLRVDTPALLPPWLPDSVQRGAPVTLVAEIANWDGGEYDVAWDFGDGSSAIAESVTHTYAKAGHYSGSVTLTGKGVSDSKPFNVRVVDNLTPHEQRESARSTRYAVRIDSVYGRRELNTGEVENYRVRIKGDVAGPVQYTWEMGDGVASIGNNIVHFYQLPGHYVVRVIGRNGFGADTTRFVVNVTERAEPSRRDVARRTSRDAPTTETVAPSTTVGTSQTRMEDPTTSDRYFAWIIETHFDRFSADAAVRRYAGRGLESLRVYLDRSGDGSDAYRIIVGNYRSTRHAVVARSDVEAKSRRPTSLLTIEK